MDNSNNIKITIENLNVFYNKTQALFDINMNIKKNDVTALIGPSGCGKSSFMRCINRMNDTIESCSITGSIKIDGTDIYSKLVDTVLLRSNVGMVFQKANPFPKSIYDNVAYGPRIHNMTKNKSELNDIVEKSLTKSGLWNEVKDRLKESSSVLSGGQQQRLCIARTIAIEPEILLMDEPCSALDPIATAKIEELITELRKNFTIIMITHSMQQAKRISSETAFFHMGNLIEFGTTDKIFNNPTSQNTEDYINGKFGNSIRFILYC